MKQQNSKKPYNNFLKYSNLAFQIMAIFVAGVFGGFKLDTLTTMKFPLFTLIFSLLSIALVIYISVKDFIKK